MGFVLGVVVRVFVLGLLSWGLAELGVGSRAERVVGADVGAGLIEFALLALVAFLWALRDGRQHRVVPAAVTWLVVAALYAAITAVRPQGFDAGINPDLLIRDLVDVSPFVFGLVAVPGVLGSAFGGGGGSSRR